jgi:hypothetical protein
VANNPLESADKKYYASRQPLNLNGTREGRKNPRKAFSYQQKPNDVTSSANKYYASPEQPAPNETGKAPSTKKELILRYKASDKVLQDVVGGFQEGGTLIEITGNQDEIRRARAAIDMAVGRNTLTRAQADAITFITIADTPLVELEPEPPKKKATRKKVTKKKTTRKKAKKKEESDDLVDGILQSAEADAPPTEADIAAAFGVVDDDDDDSDD